MIVTTPHPDGFGTFTTHYGTVLKVYPMDAEEYPGTMMLKPDGTEVIHYLIGHAIYWESYHNLAGAKVKLWLKSDMIQGIYVEEYPQYSTPVPVLTAEQLARIVSILKGETE